MSVHSQIVKANFRVPAALNFNGLNDVDIVNDRVRIANHGISVGQAMGFAVATGLPTGLAVDTAYYAIVPNASQVSFATSRANAFAGTAIDLTAVGADATAELRRNAMGTVLLDQYIPVNALVVNAYYDVITTFTSTTDAATIALQIENAGDLVAAIAISDASNVWDAGIRGCLPGAGTTTLTEAGPNTRTRIVHAADIAAGRLLIGADSRVAAVVAADALTAGELNLFIEYVFSATSA